MVLETVSENFMSVRWKFSPWHAFEVRVTSVQGLLGIFVNGIIS